MSFINIKEIKRIEPELKINKQGRLSGNLIDFDSYYKIEIDKKERQLNLTILERETDEAVKSSVESTRVPFINVARMCKYMFGENKEKWVHGLEFIKKGENESKFLFKIK